LAVSGDTRNKTLPQVPAANEVIANYPSIVGFVALYAPAHTPARQLEQLIREVNKVVTSEEYTKRLDKDGSTAKTFANASEAKDFFDKEGPKWEALTVEAGLKVE
jgi:tripartite-type tricarboxylate transporter receptor subunit TctC